MSTTHLHTQMPKSMILTHKSKTSWSSEVLNTKIQIR